MLNEPTNTNMRERQLMIADFTHHIKRSDRGEYYRIKDRLKVMNGGDTITMSDTLIETLRCLHREWFPWASTLSPRARHVAEINQTYLEVKSAQYFEHYRNQFHKLHPEFILTQLCSEWGRPMP